jgi:hypothetical protein
MTRHRAYLLIVALVLIGGIAVGIQNGARRDRALHEFDWGNRYQPEGQPSSSGVLNRVNVVVPFDAGEQRFSYYTGGQSWGTGEPSAAPERVIAQGMHGAVTVRLRAFDAYTRERGDAEAAELARIISLATTRVWPSQPIPVRVDVHVMPDDAPFSLAKRVDWEEGDVYAIAVFMRDRASFPTTAAHELYHALAGRWSLGNKDPASRSRAKAARAFEEATADLFVQCGQLLATGSLSRDTRNDTFVMADQRFEGALDSEELGRALDLLSREVPGSEELGPWLSRTVLADVFGEHETVSLDSPQGERLVARCRESAANPMLLSFRLAEMQRTSGAQPERRTVDD